ncbi:class I SAM-dependent methyltransferase [Spirulina sp. CS-785/01]|uniref:class I SAM-dependent methyltransferase n=1 Tax=Spirulina sp. CS-785/01 TaxID=3021716 RepID=UPI00232CF77B|nr:class I SAM-dependent methyltransferase [Spirulina sp. CS-785/01]MDB9313051.1 class I SAM-dependent methyltransferase [Spirulina sp. CS-785/01]
MTGQCRFCKTKLEEVFADLGMSPLANAYLKPEDIQGAEKFYPLRAYVCNNCYLVQLDELESPEEIFSNYAYFSSFSDSWLKHCQEYVEQAIKQLNLDSQSQVIELASNDGYLLQYFKKKNIEVLGVEPAANVAQIATDKGIPTIVKFFGEKIAKDLEKDGYKADLLIANNVMAHVPDLNDFIKGMKVILKSTGVITIEFPHLLNLMQKNQFDTIYHEHFSYFSLTTVETIFLHHQLKIFDVEQLSTHGGSLRIYASHIEDNTKHKTTRFENLKKVEEKYKIQDLKSYHFFQEQVKETKRSILEFLIQVKREGKSIVAYGAPAKGNTLLNYCGIRSDFIDFTVDRSPYKQGLYLPGTHILIKHPDQIKAVKPDYVMILPWNLTQEIMQQISYIRDWGGKFVVPIPEIKVY